MQPCPRQAEATMATQRQHQSHWRDDGTCSYCGSLSPELFWEAINGGNELGPTDKDYKVYVDRPDPDAGTPWIYTSQNFEPESKEGWQLATQELLDSLPKFPRAWHQHQLGHWVRIEPKHAIRHDKFYFYHLDEEGQRRFIEMLNGGVLNIGYPGRFYRLPFFMRAARQEK